MRSLQRLAPTPFVHSAFPFTVSNCRKTWAAARLAWPLTAVLLSGVSVPGFAQVGSAAPVFHTTVIRPSSAPPGSSQTPGLPQLLTRVQPNLTPVNTGPGIVYTCDPNVDATKPGTCNYLNTTVAGHYNDTFTNANASIYIKYGATGLGSSFQYLNFITYNQYVTALGSNANKSAIQVAAQSALSTYDATPYGSGNVEVTSALGTTLGFTGLFGTDSSSNFCTIGSAGCYNAIITITNDPGITLYYDNLGGNEPAGAYDFYTTVEHETDEVLGTSSCVSTQGNPLSDGCGSGIPSAVDLFRYSSPGNLVLDSSLSTTPGAYFSYDGGSTNGANGKAGTPKVYNTLDNGDDYADYVASSPDCGTNQAVQDATGCPGEDTGLTILNDGGSEINILTAVGYQVPVNPTLSVVKSHTGNFTQGQAATWLIQVNNTGSAATSGTLNMSDTLPTSYTLASYISTGSAWTCNGLNSATVDCSSTTAIASGGNSTITLTVNVPANSPTSVSNTALAWGGGDPVHTSSGTAVSSNTDTATVVQVPASIAINGSQTQATAPGTAFGSLAVTVEDGGGVAIPNYTPVVFTAPASGASGTFSNSSNTTSIAANGSGIANPGTFTANGTGGGYSLTVTAGAASTFFSLSNGITPTITWNPVGTIIAGDAGATVLNATVNCTSCGTITYTATLNPGGTPTAITTTSGLVAGNYTLAATFNPSSNAYNTTSSMKQLAVSGESVWIVNSGGGTAELAGNGSGITQSPYTGANLAVAVDSAGNVWSAGTGSSLLVETSQVGTNPNTIASGTGGLNAPAGIAIDGASQVWVTNGNSTVSEFSSAGAAVSPSSGFTDPSLSTPSGIAVDLGGSVWIANKGNNSVTRILGGAAPVAPLATAAKNNTTGAKP